MSTKLEQLRRRSNPIGTIAPILERIPMIKGDKGDKGDSIKGDPGPTGPPGKTPIKGEDYFTPQEIDEMVALVQSRIVPAAPGKPGKNGSNPVRGLDYWSTDDQEAIIREVLKRLPKPKAPAAVDHQGIAETAVKKALEAKAVKIEHVDGLGKALEGLLRRGGFRGGGGNVMAGSNVTVTRNADGSQTVSSTGGSGFTKLAATEVPNGSAAVFTFAAATSQPQFLVIDYAQKPATAANGAVNWTWNAGAKQATLNTTGGQCPPPNEDIYGIQ